MKRTACTSALYNRPLQKCHKIVFQWHLAKRNYAEAAKIIPINNEMIFIQTLMHWGIH